MVPSKFRKNVLQSLHQSHLGIVKTKAMARSKMDAGIEQLIKSCDACKLARPNPEKSSLIPGQPTDSVWSRVHVDFAGPVNGFQFLIVIDSHSKWPDVFKTKNTTTTFVIGKLRERKNFRKSG